MREKLAENEGGSEDDERSNNNARRERFDGTNYDSWAMYLENVLSEKELWCRIFSV
jgi:hypothetical protein